MNEISETVGDSTYLIPENNFSRLEKAIEKLSRKAVKLTGEEISLIVYGYQMKEVKPGQYVKFIEVLIGGPEVKLNGWQFIARLDCSDKIGGNILYHLPNTNIPKEYRTLESNCDHCNVKRYRRDTFILRNVETNEYKQVGRTCLRDFLGHRSPEQIAELAQLIGQANALGANSTTTMGSDRHCLNLVSYLALVAAASRQYGWISKAKAGGNFESTSEFALDYLMGHRPRHQISLLPEDTEIALASIEWAKDLSNNGTQLSDYYHNLNVISNQEFIEIRAAGYAAAIVFAYSKATGTIIDKRSIPGPKQVSTHVGGIKDKIEFEGKVISRTNFETQFGESSRIRMNDLLGNEFVWFTSSRFSFKEGDSIVVRGTVKEHTEYKGVKQTVITRCKVEAV